MKRLYLISVVLSLALALAACGSSGSDNPQATQPTATPSTHVTQATQPTATPTPFNWRTLKPTYANGNTPYYGGRLSDFLGFLGRPATSDSNTLTWHSALAWIDGSTSSNTWVTAGYDGNKVIKVSVLDMNPNSSWSMEISKEACIPFEPPGTHLYNDTGATGGTEYLDFHSDMGDFVMAVSSGACDISAPSS